MTRTTGTMDRVATFVVAVVLVAAGVLGIVWRLGRWPALPDRLRTGSALRLMEEGWWPVAIAVVGIALGLLGLRWLFAHLASSGVREVNLPGSGRDGRLRVDVKAAAQAAADALAETPGIRQVGGKAARQRGQLVVDLRAVVDADAELAEIADASDRVSSELARVLERPDIFCRVRVGVSGRSGGRRLR